MRDVTIQPLNKEVMEACRLRIDNLTKPLYSLAHLEKNAERLSGIFEVVQPRDLRHSVVLVGSDCTVERTTFPNQTNNSAILEVLSKGHSATHAAAKKLGAPVYIVNVGIDGGSIFTGIIDKQISKGSNLTATNESISTKDLEAALEAGFEMADLLKEEGRQTVAIGTIGNHSVPSAVCIASALTGKLTMDLAKGTGVEDIAGTLQAAGSRADSAKALSVLGTVGSLDIATLVGLILGAAMNRIAVVYDNEITAAAVLLATAIDEGVKDYVFQSVACDNETHKALLEALGVKPFLFYHMTMAEGLGSTLGLSVLDASLYMLNDMKTFADAAVNVAEDGPGSERQSKDVSYGEGLSK